MTSRRSSGYGSSASASLSFFPRGLHEFNKVAVETVAYKVNNEKLRIQFFDDPEAAALWLETRPSEG